MDRENDTAVERRLVPIPQLPQSISDTARDRIRRFAVSLIATGDDGDDRDAWPCSGTLVTLSGRQGLLTANHVWAAALRSPVLAVYADTSFVRMKVADLQAFTTKANTHCPTTGARVPDICFIPLPSNYVAAIGARGKAFYSIDRRGKCKEFDLYGDEGFYVVHGCPNALLRKDPGQEWAIGSMLYLTQAHSTYSIGDWDFVLVNLDLDGNPVVPDNFEGVSGGGLWRVVFVAGGERGEWRIEDVRKDVMLVGVNFYQTAEPGRQLLAHGPGSVYRTLPRFVPNASSASTRWTAISNSSNDGNS